MASAVLLTVAAVACFVMALVGATSVKCIARISSKWMLLGNAAAGGVLIAVSLVHMLSDNAEGMEGWGKAINAALGGDADEAFPLPFMLVGLGFFLIIAMEQLLGGHDHGGSEEKGHGHGHGGHSHEGHENVRDSSEEDLEEPCPEQDSENSSDSDQEAITKSRGSMLAGLGTLIGITIHSFIESVAMGSAPSESALLTLMAAVLFHKTFSAFAVGSSLQGVNASSPAMWWVLVLIFAAAAPVGIAVGAACGANLEGQSSAALQCVASGTLLAIGITEMLLPALSGSEVHRRRRLFAAIGAFAAVSLLAVWA